MTRILGIDPGSRVTGYGVIDMSGQNAVYIASGVVRTQEEHFPARLKTIFEGIAEVVQTYQPDEMAIEKVFVQRNVDSALKLGQARGAAICAVVTQPIKVYEFSATQIKQAVVGNGHALKDQVQHMVKVLLGLQGLQQEISTDASDALACALCHGHTRRFFKMTSAFPKSA